MPELLVANYQNYYHWLLPLLYKLSSQPRITRVISSSNLRGHAAATATQRNGPRPGITWRSLRTGIWPRTFPSRSRRQKGSRAPFDEQGRAGQLVEGLIPQLLRFARGVQRVTQEDQAAGPHVLGHELGRQAGPHGLAPQVERQALEFVHFGHVFQDQTDRRPPGWRPGRAACAPPRHREN